MTTRKLTTVLNLVTDRLAHENIQYCIIGALALGRYGLPRFTADIDLLTEGRHWPLLSQAMTELGFECFQKTPSFARYDSKREAFGDIDFLFVETRDGVDLLQRSVVMEDELFGRHPIVQPTDFFILKFMAIANNPDRLARDETDILAVLKLSDGNLIPEEFQSLDMGRLQLFAERFGQTRRLEGYIKKINRKKSDTSRTFVL